MGIECDGPRARSALIMATAVYPTMTPAAQDPLQALLVKAGYWAQSVAEAAGGPFTSGMYPNMTPFAQDPLQVLAAKLAYWLEQISVGGGGGGGGSPTDNQALGGLAPVASTKYFVYDTDTGFLWYNSGTIGAPTWQNV